MSVYSPEVAFTCTFSEPVALASIDRVFVPNFVSISPTTGASETFVIRAGVVDNTMGQLTLVLGPGAFKSGDALSEEYSASVSCAPSSSLLTPR